MPGLPVSAQRQKAVIAAPPISTRVIRFCMSLVSSLTSARTSYTRSRIETVWSSGSRSIGLRATYLIYELALDVLKERFRDPAEVRSLQILCLTTKAFSLVMSQCESYREV